MCPVAIFFFLQLNYFLGHQPYFVQLQFFFVLFFVVTLFFVDIYLTTEAHATPPVVNPPSPHLEAV